MSKPRNETVRYHLRARFSVDPELSGGPCNEKSVLLKGPIDSHQCDSIANRFFWAGRLKIILKEWWCHWRLLVSEMTGVIVMKNFRELGEARLRRTKFAREFCVGAEIPLALMAFFEGKSKSFTETWIGQSDSMSKERGQDMIKTAEAKLAVWAALRTQKPLDSKSNDCIDTTGNTLTWMNAGDYIIGIGTPIAGVFPVLAIPRGSNRELPVRQLLMRLGMAFVAQQLTEEVYERNSWMESLVETATQALSIQFVVVTAEGEIRYDSRQKQPHFTKRPNWMVRKGRLSLLSEEENSELQDAIRDATSFEKRTSIVSIFTSPGVARLVVVTPMTVSESTMALVLFESEQIDHFKLREHFFSAYRLTKSESMIAHEILSGRSIAEAAETKSLSLATVRSYMKQVLAKTGTHKQSELISLYFNSILPVNSDLEMSD